METRTNYGQLNTITVTGRISFVREANGKFGKFLDISVKSTLTNDGQTITYKFNTSDLFSQYNAGMLATGRQVSLTGSLKNVSEVFVNKEGNYQVREAGPVITLDGARIAQYGPLSSKTKQDVEALKTLRAVRPSDANAYASAEVSNEAPVDETPAFAAVEAY